MKQTTGNLWAIPAQVKVIPTNGMYTQIDTHVFRAHMGRGVARQLADMWPNMLHNLGERLHEHGNRLYVFQAPLVLRETFGCVTLVTFPTKHDWRDSSPPDLIVRSAAELDEAAIQNGWRDVLLPRVGCGLGGLDWETQVEPLLSYLSDRFTVIHPE